MKDVTVDQSVIIVTENNGANNDGSIAKRTWTMNPDQAEKHIPTFEDHPETIRNGDKSAIRDAASEYRKTQEYRKRNK